MYGGPVWSARDFLRQVLMQHMIYSMKKNCSADYFMDKFGVANSGRSHSSQLRIFSYHPQVIDLSQVPHYYNIMYALNNSLSKRSFQEEK